MRIGIQTGDVIKDFGLEAGYRMIAEAGFECLDLNLDHMFEGSRLREGTYRGSSPMEEGLSALMLVYAKELDTIKKYGLTVSQIHAPFPSYASGNEDSLDYMIELHRTAIRFADAIGAKNLVIHGISRSVQDKNDTQDRIDELNFKLYSSLIPTLRECNVTVCLENLPTWYTDGKGFRMIYAGHCCDPYEATAEIDMLNELAGKECFGLCLDTGHLNITRTPVTKYISVLGERIKCLHIHDNNGMDDSHMAPYTGSVRWQDYISALRAIGYNGDLSFETFRQTTKSVMPPELASPWLKLMAAEANYFREKILE